MTFNILNISSCNGWLLLGAAEWQKLETFVLWEAFETSTDRRGLSLNTLLLCAFLHVDEMRADWFLIGRLMRCVKPMVCLLPFKANTAKQSHGAGRGRAGRLTAGHAPRSQAATNQTQKRRRATTPTVLWLALMGLNLQQKVVAWLSIAFSVSLVLIEGLCVCVCGGRVVIGVRRGGEKFPGTGGGVLTNQHK